MAQHGAAEIRPLASQDELVACVALQHEIWGKQFTDTVAPSVLQVCQRVGGVASGAFDREGKLLGFVFGLTGVRDGQIVHWSDMLAVRTDARNSGIAMALKSHQRDVVRELGGSTIYWTFDPLVARNAYINFNKLGVFVDEYVPNMYGTTDSDLHGGLPTDRFVVAWPTDDVRVALRLKETRKAAEENWSRAPVVNARLRTTGPILSERVRIEVPADFESLVRTDPRKAARWRKDTRAAFEQTLGKAYNVSGFVVGGSPRRAFYLLERAPT
jgi:predicted GNAT superfamily acetyltransferase